VDALCCVVAKQGADAEGIQECVEGMRDTVSGWEVTGYSKYVDKFDGVDAQDRHVAAAAYKLSLDDWPGQAVALVTNNVNDFPVKAFAECDTPSNRHLMPRCFQTFRPWTTIALPCRSRMSNAETMSRCQLRGRNAREGVRERQALGEDINQRLRLGTRDGRKRRLVGRVVATSVCVTNELYLCGMQVQISRNSLDGQVSSRILRSYFVKFQDSLHEGIETFVGQDEALLRVLDVDGGRNVKAFRCVLQKTFESAFRTSNWLERSCLDEVLVLRRSRHAY